MEEGWREIRLVFTNYSKSLVWPKGQQVSYKASQGEDGINLSLERAWCYCGLCESHGWSQWACQHGTIWTISEMCQPKFVQFLHIINLGCSFVEMLVVWEDFPVSSGLSCLKGLNNWRVLPVELMCNCLGCQMFFCYMCLSFFDILLCVMCLIKGASTSNNGKITLCGTPWNVNNIVQNWNFKFTPPYLQSWEDSYCTQPLCNQFANEIRYCENTHHQAFLLTHTFRWVWQLSGFCLGNGE